MWIVANCITQNGLNLSDYRILRSTISQEKIDESVFYRDDIGSKFNLIYKFLVGPGQKSSQAIRFQVS